MRQLPNMFMILHLKSVELYSEVRIPRFWVSIPKYTAFVELYSEVRIPRFWVSIPKYTAFVPCFLHINLSVQLLYTLL